MVRMATGWVAVWTRSRHEKFVYGELIGRDVEAFLPLVRVPSTRRDRRSMVEKPAFPGYLFARIGCNESVTVRGTRGVVGIVGPTRTGHSTIPDEQIENVRRMVESDLCVDPYPWLRVGSPVRIKSGPLRGLTGLLVERRQKLQVVVSVDLLQDGLAAEVSADQVESA